MRRPHYKTNLVQALPALLFVVAAGVLGLRALGLSQAATYSSLPTGAVDYCRLEGSATVIYGWAYDPDAPVGPLPNVSIRVGSNPAVTVASDIAGYRDASINALIQAKYRGAPPSSVYGWKLSLNGLYKSNQYVLAATVLNYGHGSDVNIPVNSSQYVDDDTTKPYFNADNSVPDACLNNEPNPAGPTVFTSAADATVSTGTTSAVLAVPADGASKVHIAYSEHGKVAVNSIDQIVKGASTKVTLSNLAATTQYEYRIVRTNSAGKVATSPAAIFTTKGYTIALQFTNDAQQPVADIKGTLDNSKITATADTHGRMAFQNLPGGTYTVTYIYHGHIYTEPFDTKHTSQSLNKDHSPEVITLNRAVNVDKLSLAAPLAPKHNGPLYASVAGVVLLAIIGGTVWFLLRQHKAKQLMAEYGALSSFSANPTTGTPLKLPTHATTDTPLPAHAGESLRDLVIHSMHTPAPSEPQDQPSTQPAETHSPQNTQPTGNHILQIDHRKR